MCDEKDTLLRTYRDALNALLGHLRLQSEALCARESNYDRFDDVISSTERQKQEAAEAYRDHVAMHGCGCPFYLALEVEHGRALSVSARSADQQTSVTEAAMFVAVRSGEGVSYSPNAAS